MSVALDVGSFRVRSLRRAGPQLAVRAARAAYVAFPDDPARRRLLERLGIPHAACEDGLVALGDAAVELARVLSVPLVDILPAGHVPADDPPARQILSVLVEALLVRSAAPGEPCGLILPSGFGEDDPRTRRDERFLGQLVRLRGYEPHVVGSATALALATLGDCGFSGVAVDVGACGTEIACLRHGREVRRGRLPVGGRSIDAALAVRFPMPAADAHGAPVPDVEAARIWKESRTTSIAEGTEPDALLLRAAHVELLERIRDGVLELLESGAKEVADLRGVLVLGGGTMRMPGCDVLAARILQSGPRRIGAGELRLAAEPDHVVARGALIATELEQRSRTARAA